MSLALPLDDEVLRLSGEFGTALAESGKCDPDICRNLSALAFYTGQLTSFATRLTGKDRTQAMAAVFAIFGEGFRAEMEEAAALAPLETEEVG